METNYSEVTVGNFNTVRKKILADVSGDTFSKAARYLPLCVAIILTIGVIITMMLGLKPSYLFKEGRPFTHFSGLLLLMISASSLHIFKIRWQNDPLPWHQLYRKGFFVWLIMGTGFIFLWADEVACYHEKMGNWIQAQNSGYTGIFAERFDSLVVGTYGIVSLAVLWIYRREFLDFIMCSKFFILGFSLLFLMVGLDFLTEDMKIIRMLTTDKVLGDRLFMLLEVMEDYFKLMAVAFFLRGFLEIRWQVLSENRETTPIYSN
ncbi:MAG: hypothetical protein ACFCU1_02145 [Sumerlaeia bacterium]